MWLNKQVDVRGYSGPGGGTQQLHHKHLRKKMHDVVTYSLLKFVQLGLVIVLFGSLLEVFLMGLK